jgi:hypothetical protein
MATKRGAAAAGKKKAPRRAAKSAKRAPDPRVPGVRLFEDFEFGGAYDDYADDTPYIGDELNKKVSSFTIQGGVWQFYSGPNYTHRVGRPLYPGAYSRTSDVGIPNDSIVSFKQVPKK